MDYLPENEFNPDKFVRIPSVAIFKEHERDKGGRRIKVTKKDLQQIADNHNQKFRLLGVGVPLSYGHTLDGDVKEEEQPELLGWCVNFSVDKLPTGEDTLFGDFYLPKDKASWILDNLPTRSVEYFPNSQRLHPIALLKTSAPELDLPVIRYSGEDAPYRFSFSAPLNYTHSENEMKCDENEKKAKYEDGADKPMEDAKKEVSKGAVTEKSEVAELKEQMAQVMQMLGQVMPVIEQIGGLLSDEEGAGEGEDLMKPAGKSMDKPEMKEEGGDEEEDEEKDAAAKVEGPPVKFDSMVGSPTNSYIPSHEKDKFMSNDEAVKYKKKVAEMEAELLKYKKEQAAKDAVLNELIKDKKALQAKEWVRKLEEEETVQYASEEVRQADIKFFEQLEATEAKNYFEMAKVRYQKKTPKQVGAAKYQAAAEPQLGQIDVDALIKAADAAVASGKSAKEVLSSFKK